MSEPMQAFSVRGVALDEKNRSPLVILYNDSSQMLVPLHIGTLEASSILTAIEGVHPARPLTHDVMAQIFVKHGFDLLCVEIYSTSVRGLLARLRYQQGDSQHLMEVRPSDAVSLAIRLGAPILLSDQVVSLLGTREHACEAPSPDIKVLFLKSQAPEVPPA